MSYNQQGIHSVLVLDLGDELGVAAPGQKAVKLDKLFFGQLEVLADEFGNFKAAQCRAGENQGDFYLALLEELGNFFAFFLPFFY